MQSYKTIRLNPDDFILLSGKEKHEVELPYAEHMDLWIEWKADRDVHVWLFFTDGKRIPFANGLSGHASIRTQRLLSVVLECTKSTTVAFCGQWKDLAVTEKADWTPVEIVPPDPVQFKLGQAVRVEMARMGLLTPGEDSIDVSEEDNLEDDFDEGEQFGEGYMEADEAVLEKVAAKQARGKRATKPVAGSGDPAGSDNDQSELPGTDRDVSKSPVE